MNAVMNRGRYDGENKFTGDMLIKAFSVGGSNKSAQQKLTSPTILYMSGYPCRGTEATPNDAWQNEAKNTFPQAYKKLKNKFEELESMEDDGGFDELVAMLTEIPKGLVDPVFSRWQTVAKSAKIVVEHWVIIYFIAVAVKQDADSGSYLWQLACTLLSLMNTCAEPLDDGTTIDEYIESFDSENEPEEEVELSHKRKDSYILRHAFVGARLH